MRATKFVSLLFISLASKVSSLFWLSQNAVAHPALTDDYLKIAQLCRDMGKNEFYKTFVSSTDTGAQATVALDGSTAIVCFRGSNNLEDLSSNLRISRTPLLSRKHKNPRLEVHSGFFTSHNSIKGKIYTKLNAMIESGKCDSVLFAGHSTGATLAAISAFDFQNDKNLRLEVVTFGSPKIGNAAFASAFHKSVKCTRIVNDNDCVALAPLFGGYRHVGDVIRLKNIAPKKPKEDLKIWHTLVNFARLDSVFDMDIFSYIATIEAQLRKNQK